MVSREGRTLIAHSAGQAAYQVARIARQNSNLSDTNGQLVSVLVVVPDVSVAERLTNDLTFLLQGDAAHKSDEAPVVCFLPWDVLPFDGLSPSLPTTAERITTLWRITKGEKLVVVTTPSALIQKLVPPKLFQDSITRVGVGEAIDRDQLALRLVQAGYVRTTLVEEFGQLAIRGAVIDCFSPQLRAPVRLELFGDRVESIRLFDPASQRSLSELADVDLLPAREFFYESDRLEKAFTLLKARASELEVSPRIVLELQTAIQTDSTWPGIEHLQALFSPSMTTLSALLPSSAAVICFDEVGIDSAIDSFNELILEQAERSKHEGRLHVTSSQFYCEADEAREWLRERRTHSINSVQFVSERELEDELGGKSVHNADASFPNASLAAGLKAARQQKLPYRALADEITKRIDEGLHVAISVTRPSRTERLRNLLATYEIDAVESPAPFCEWLSNNQEGVPAKRSVTLLHGALSSGVRVPVERFLLIAENEIFPDASGARRLSKATNVSKFLRTYAQLQEGDFIVHVDHGVALYHGLKQITIEGGTGDYLHLEYADGAKLFLPVEHIGKIQKYVSAEGKKPTLNKLGGKQWPQTKRKVRETIEELAGQLVALYAQRQMVQGFSFGPVDSDDLMFGDTFAFEPTADQAKAIEAVLGDMERTRPMDRLVCGDVGYGKTEVALRAAFKAVNRGKQVAVLVPTTVLADQHYANFRERFREFPFRIGCVSRFFSTAENKDTLAKVSKGEVDVVIGTHRLLQKDVFFKDLGLVIIDEEHRFGVAHKEKLKNIRTEVDVLTLTATPIPRTLNMSLLGIRDLSLIETPPVDRQVIRTYLTQFDPDNPAIVREAIMRELSRNGQVFYIHNRVQNIELIAEETKQLVPEARLAFAHGQMKEGELETIMHRFVNKEIDVLVSTTIVESGLDIPNANTIIIRNAQNFGLAELYQLRGRVGRSSRRAYAYLLVPDPKKLGEDAKKRLQVLQSLDDLGVGFRLALQDMEIRGAGNLLGKDQSGQIDLVGFELYTDILKSTIEELKEKGSLAGVPGLERGPITVDPEVKIGFTAHLPTDYIPDVTERILLYQRLVALGGQEEGEQLREEIEDRFGRLPAEVHTLVDYMVFRSLLRRALIVAVTLRDKVLRFLFHPDAPLDVEQLLKVVAASRGQIKVTPSREVVFDLKDRAVENPRDLYMYLAELLMHLKISV